MKISEAYSGTLTCENCVLKFSKTAKKHKQHMHLVHHSSGDSGTVHVLFLFSSLPTGVRPGHIKNALVGVVYIAIIKHSRVHSSYDRVLPTCYRWAETGVELFYTLNMEMLILVTFH